MTELVRQFAIRLPNGSLYTPPEPENPWAWLAGVAAERAEPRVAVFDREADAQRVLSQLREMAARVGVSHLGAAVVARFVGPWGDHDFDSFVDEVEKHVNGGGR